MLTADERAYLRESRRQLPDTHDFQHDPLFNTWIKNLTEQILDGVFPRKEIKGNEEALKYLWKHPTKKLECGPQCIKLFKPLDEEKFMRCFNDNIKYKANERNQDEDFNKKFCNYYLNNIHDLKEIFTLIDDIYAKEVKPFKISFDAGFIVEDVKNKKYEISRPSVEMLGKTVPMVIRGPSEVKLYKHIVFSTLGEYTSEVHLAGGSSHRFVAMHSIMFQVTRLGGEGARFLVPGYDFLIKNKYIRDYGNNNNLCIFYILANTRK